MNASPPAPSAPGREASHFDQLTRLIHEHIGVRLPPSKRQMVEGRLRRRRMALGFGSVDDYFHHLFEQGGLEAELHEILDAVTTNKTDFFREPDHFRLLVDRIVPQTLQHRPMARRRSLFKVWSAAASTGAEAFTLAMLLEDLSGRLPDLNYGILGTDINTEVLETARRAIYPVEQMDPVPPAFRTRFLMQGSGSLAGQVRIVPELRQRTRFARMNLMDPQYTVDRDIDVIFLRNVLIYFDPADQARVIARMISHLAPGGHLLVGHSESMVVRSAQLKQIAPAVFQRN
ncbi:MAG: protein-glutamate O-methyltransferase [Cereibacter changlensis]|uniref:Chemotaxis protein methyltransferase n=2 Tax=Cereibacter changlensis TaxID=402884 RepID=A0A2T4JRI8_9RHOB|nr:protein-glutamate O-methyltransferase [Cereibacter changlensis]PTE20525.1 chemotaxis protein CheR [Cereibacter changlensis JA139]PZX51756.1 chemotaxis protein methyltransferase CheR [Cereibacter changlensis]